MYSCRLVNFHISFNHNFQVLEFCTGFETYSNLWIEDRESYMQSFLTYGRQLTYDEIELNILPDPQSPTMDMFKQQVSMTTNKYIYFIPLFCCSQFYL